MVEKPLSLRSRDVREGEGSGPEGSRLRLHVVEARRILL